MRKRITYFVIYISINNAVMKNCALVDMESLEDSKAEHKVHIIYINVHTSIYSNVHTPFREKLAKENINHS